MTTSETAREAMIILIRIVFMAFSTSCKGIERRRNLFSGTLIGRDSEIEEVLLQSLASPDGCPCAADGCFLNLRPVRVVLHRRRCFVGVPQNTAGTVDNGDPCACFFLKSFAEIVKVSAEREPVSDRRSGVPV